MKLLRRSEVSSGVRQFSPFLVVLAGVCIDLGTKAWARGALEPYGGAREFLPFISLRLTINEGISFSMLSFGSEGARMLLLAFTLLVSAAIAVWAWRASGLERFSLCVILAGAVGNLIDRALNGAVTDFLDLQLGAWPLFVFNLADVWITAGVAVLLVASLCGSCAPRMTGHDEGTA